jgi:creatinine amidohydrolase
VGNPARATAEKGERYVEALTTAVSEFLLELSALDPDDIYE